MMRIDLPTFLGHRLDEERRFADLVGDDLPPASEEHLREMAELLQRWEIARGTLARVPTGYAQGVLEGLRQGMATKAYRWNDHPDHDKSWASPLHQDDEETTPRA
jgi:hypothetical protein